MVSGEWDWLHGPVFSPVLSTTCLLQSPRVCPSPRVTPLRLGFLSPLLSRVMLERTWSPKCINQQRVTGPSTLWKSLLFKGS